LAARAVEHPKKSAATARTVDEIGPIAEPTVPLGWSVTVRLSILGLEIIWDEESAAESEGSTPV
jgi:hypothetical protein